MILTARQKFVIRAALGYARSNADDINDAFAAEPDTHAINVGGFDRPTLEDDEVQALIDLFVPTPHTAPSGLRAFKGTFLVAIDPSEADMGDGEPPPTVGDLTSFLKDALALDVDTEEYGNPVGFRSAELLFDTLEELPADEVRRLSGR